MRSATAGLLDLMARTAPASDVQQLLTRLPGASELLAALRPGPPQPASGVAAALGDLVTNAATAIQGTIGSGAALVRLFAEVGLDPQKAGQFLGLFVSFARQQVGGDVVDRVIGSIPGARQFFK